MLVAEAVLGGHLLILKLVPTSTKLLLKLFSLGNMIKKLTSTDFSDSDCNTVKFSYLKNITVSYIIPCLIHKYIWDQPNDTNVELDYQPEEIITNIDALETI